MAAKVFEMSSEQLRAWRDDMNDHFRRAEALGLNHFPWPTDVSGFPIPLDYLETHQEQFGLPWRR